MYKSLILICAVCLVIIEARPKWQVLPPMPGYVPVYIRTGDTPLEEINPDLAEAFHALPVGRSAGKLLEASPEIPEQADQPDQILLDVEPEESPVDHRPYEKKLVDEKKVTDVLNPVERR